MTLKGKGMISAAVSKDNPLYQDLIDASRVLADITDGERPSNGRIDDASATLDKFAELVAIAEHHDAEEAVTLGSVLMDLLGGYPAERELRAMQVVAMCLRSSAAIGPNIHSEAGSYRDGTPRHLIGLALYLGGSCSDHNVVDTMRDDCLATTAAIIAKWEQKTRDYALENSSARRLREIAASVMKESLGEQHITEQQKLAAAIEALAADIAAPANDHAPAEAE